jgi:hypothetical protein
LIAIQAYAEETIAMTEDARLKDTLSGIAGAANDLRRAYEESPEDKRPYADIAQFARDARKAIEPYLFQYKQPAALKQEEPRWCFPNNNKEGEEKMKTEKSKILETKLQEAEMRQKYAWEDKDLDEVAAKELYLYIVNDAQLYRQQYEPIIRNLAAKKARGVYNHTLAVKLFGYLVESGAKKYVKELGSADMVWHEMFPKKLRDAVAEELTINFEEEWEAGSYREFVPKKYRGEVNGGFAQDSLLSEIASQLCTGGVCFATKDNHQNSKIGGKEMEHSNPKTKSNAIRIQAWGYSDTPSEFAIEAAKKGFRFIEDYEYGYTDIELAYWQQLTGMKRIREIISHLVSHREKGDPVTYKPVYQSEFEEEAEFEKEKHSNPVALPICSPSEAKALERCITRVKAKQPKYCEKEWHKPPEKMREGCYNPWAVCRASVGCRLGGTEEYERKVG